MSESVIELPNLPPRPADGHKGSFGRLLILGGCEGMIGAPAFTGLAALRGGCGLAYIATAQSILPTVLSVAPELVGIPLRSLKQDRRFQKLADSADALVIGPGMGLGDEAGERLSWLLTLPKPAVVDADALTLLSQGRIAKDSIRLRAVFTPHPGEMLRLAKWLNLGDVPSDEDGRIAIASAAAVALGQVVVLKGHRTIIADAHRHRINQTGDSSLAKAGTGDVLSGLIGSLLAQGMEPFDAASLATHLHGRAGELAGQRLGPRSVLARDVIDSISQAVKELPVPA
jgi:ADP-dependent NAD(P)H-hydrate dehydratase